MLSLRHVWAYVLLSILIFEVHADSVAAQTSAGTTNATAERDGQHDFDPFAGAWKAHTKYLAHPFAGSDTWIEFDGTETFQKLWDGAMLELSERAGAKGPLGLMLYTYNPQSHQWWVYFANSKDGKLGPPNVGEFRNGRGEFFAQDTVNGKLMLNRYVWSRIASSPPHYEESWSSDGGRTWELVRIVDLARVSEDTGNAHPTGKVGSSDWNEPALKMYASLGAGILNNRGCVVLDGDHLDKLAKLSLRHDACTGVEEC